MNNIQISLFFKKDTIYKPVDFSSEISKKYSELQNPIILPENKGFPEEANAPIVLFINNKDFQVVSNYYTMTITLNSIEINKTIEIMEELLKIVSKFGIEVYRIGFVSRLSLENEKIIEFKTNKFTDKEIINSNDFELGWLTDITIGGLVVNCWERYFSNKETNDKLNVIFDINTKNDEINVITSDFVVKFIVDSNNYISNKLFK